MSLVKIYRLSCEGPRLADRLGQRIPLNEHLAFSALETTSTRARRIAKRKGWSRVTKTLPVTRDPNGPTSDVKFDLCPACSVALKEG